MHHQRNRGMLAAKLDEILEKPSVEDWCKEIRDYIAQCEKDREARTGARRLIGF
ncbi:MAG TPA: hypothetical protein VGA05_08445 [Candidatus Bathyarchaeia archaeon]